MKQVKHNQRGAVTLIGALFIVIVLSVMAMALLRMASSNILDSAANNDSTEALFVAETGIEHAAFLYSSTGSCIGLAGIGPVTAGRGSFSLLNAVVQPTGECRVRVSASVGSGLTNPAVRTIDADLRLAGSSDGWIVGDNGTILGWDGATWAAVTSPTTRDLYDVYCTSATDCNAVGERGTIIHWDGANWTNRPSNVPSDFFGRPVDLFAVSCEPGNPDNCFAAGANRFFGLSLAIIQRWNGTTWSNSAFVFNSGDWRFYDLSCPSATCYVVTANGVIGRFNPASGNWFNDTSNTTVPLNGIACTTNNYCWVVGNRTGNNWNFDFIPDAVTSWSPLTLGVTGLQKRNLNAVSCVDMNDCWAVADHGGSNYVLGHWNGLSWSPQLVGNSAQRENLNAVHCLAGNDCWAVGNYRNGGNVIHYNGASWAYIGAPVTNNVNLNGVHFPPGAGGGGGGGSSVSVIRWQEIIGN